MSLKDWRLLIAEKRAKQLASIPKEWLLTPEELPPKEVLDVTTFPDTCGRLSAKEIEITNSSVEVLLQKLAAAEWSAVEVTTAFYKRATIAHQLVS